jgi:hypothetical protein
MNNTNNSQELEKIIFLIIKVFLSRYFCMQQDYHGPEGVLVPHHASLWTIPVYLYIM